VLVQTHGLVILVLTAKTVSMGVGQKISANLVRPGHMLDRRVLRHALVGIAPLLWDLRLHVGTESVSPMRDATTTTRLTTTAAALHAL